MQVFDVKERSSPRTYYLAVNQFSNGLCGKAVQKQQETLDTSYIIEPCFSIKYKSLGLRVQYSLFKCQDSYFSNYARRRKKKFSTTTEIQIQSKKQSTHYFYIK